MTNIFKERRSIKSYTDEAIKDEELNYILEAGTYAPTGMNRQSPVMVVVRDKETIARLEREKEEFRRKYELLKKAEDLERW